MRMYPAGEGPAVSETKRVTDTVGRFVAVYPTLQLAAGAGALS